MRERGIRRERSLLRVLARWRNTRWKERQHAAKHAHVILRETVRVIERNDTLFDHCWERLDAATLRNFLANFSNFKMKSLRASLRASRSFLEFYLPAFQAEIHQRLIEIFVDDRATWLRQIVDDSDENDLLLCWMHWWRSAIGRQHYVLQ